MYLLLNPLTLSRFRRYYLSGFLTLQTTLDRFFFEHTLPPPVEDSRREESGEQSEEESEELWCIPPQFVGVPFPTAAYDQNLFYAAVGYLLGLAMTMVTEAAYLAVSGNKRGRASIFRGRSEIETDYLNFCRSFSLSSGEKQGMVL